MILADISPEAMTGYTIGAIVLLVSLLGNIKQLFAKSNPENEFVTRKELSDAVHKLEDDFAALDASVGKLKEELNKKLDDQKDSMTAFKEQINKKLDDQKEDTNKKLDAQNAYANQTAYAQLNAMHEMAVKMERVATIHDLKMAAAKSPPDIPA